MNPMHSFSARRDPLWDGENVRTLSCASKKQYGCSSTLTHAQKAPSTHVVLFCVGRPYLWKRIASLR
jgi:hypothetical protein